MYDLILIVSTNIYISYHVNNYKVIIFIIQCSQLKKYNCLIHNYLLNFILLLFNNFPKRKKII